MHVCVCVCVCREGLGVQARPGLPREDRAVRGRAGALQGGRHPLRPPGAAHRAGLRVLGAAQEVELVIVRCEMEARSVLLTSAALVQIIQELCYGLVLSSYQIDTMNEQKYLAAGLNLVKYEWLQHLALNDHGAL